MHSVSECGTLGVFKQSADLDFINTLLAYPRWILLKFIQRPFALSILSTHYRQVAVRV
jgi:hypothetical protein